MDAPKEQFDFQLGGSQIIPASFDTVKFANARLQEIMALTEAIENPQRVGLVFQQLPRHMRRRVMAHDTKRLPRAVREAHMRQFEKSGMPPSSKRPSRKYRRRPKNLLSEYNRRQKEFGWLETHIWHAKRFHMIKKWGYNLANTPNSKGFRALYRAISKHCLLQDVSYLSCIELTGPLNKLLEGFQFHTSDECGPLFGNDCCKDGAREGSISLFRHGMFPHGAIGNVSYLWRPVSKVNRKESEESRIRTIWIWIHPAYYQETLDELVGTFKLKPAESSDVVMISETNFTSPTEMEVDNDSEPRKKKPRLDKRVEEKKIETRNIPFTRTPKYQSDDGCEMVLLKDTLTRLRLTGPLSQAVLFDGLQIATTFKKSDSGIKTMKKTSIKSKPAFTATGNIDEIFAQIVQQPNRDSSSDDEVVHFPIESDVVDNTGNWWTDYYKRDFIARSLLPEQRKFWQSLGMAKLPSQLPPNLVVGLTIRDPRLCMPPRREKAVPDLTATEPVPTPTSEIYWSPIWDPTVRNISTMTKRSVAQLNADNSKSLVPGFVPESQSCQPVSDGANDHSQIPVLLIQRPGCQQASATAGFGSGWDVVCPTGWGMPLWMSLVFRGGRPGGLRETASLARESGAVPELAPDSMAGRREADARREELTDEYFRHPPNNRVNYIKLGIASPFMCAWETLARDWSPDGSAAAPQCSTGAPSPFHVLRDRCSLALLGAAVRGEPCDLATLAARRHCLVPIALTMLLKGNPVDFSVICVPSASDLEKLAADACYSGPVESPHVDVHQAARKAAHAEHQATMKRLRKRRVRKYRKEREEKASGRVDAATIAKEVTRRRPKPGEPVEKELAEAYARRCRELWLPGAATVRGAADRPTVGYVTQGEFSFSRACGAGVGYVALDGLVAMAEAVGEGRPVYVLVRNPTNFYYRFAALNVVGSD